MVGFLVALLISAGTARAALLLAISLVSSLRLLALPLLLLLLPLVVAARCCCLLPACCRLCAASRRRLLPALPLLRVISGPLLLVVLLLLLLLLVAALLPVAATLLSIAPTLLLPAIPAIPSSVTALLPAVPSTVATTTLLPAIPSAVATSVAVAAAAAANTLVVVGSATLRSWSHTELPAHHLGAFSCDQRFLCHLNRRECQEGKAFRLTSHWVGPNMALDHLKSVKVVRDVLLGCLVWEVADKQLWFCQCYAAWRWGHLPVRLWH